MAGPARTVNERRAAKVRARAAWADLADRLATVTPAALGRAVLGVVVLAGAFAIVRGTWPALVPFFAGGLIAYLALLIPILRRDIFAPTRWEDALLVGGIFAMPLLSGVLQSSGRFGLVAFPLAFAMADLGLRSERVHRAYVVYAPTAQVILFAAAALGYRPP